MVIVDCVARRYMCRTRREIICFFFYVGIFSKIHYAFTHGNGKYNHVTLTGVARTQMNPGTRLEKNITMTGGCTAIRLVPVYPSKRDELKSNNRLIVSIRSIEYTIVADNDVRYDRISLLVHTA